MKTQRVLPADVYDALELSVLSSGGLTAGSGSMHCGSQGCILANAAFLDGVYEYPVDYDIAEQAGRVNWSIENPDPKLHPVLHAVHRAFRAEAPDDVFAVNDSICPALNDDDEGNLIPGQKGMTWKAFCKRAGIVRGN